MSVSSPHSVTECPSEIVTSSSMIEEIEDLLLNPMFEMPGEPSMCTSPRRPPLMTPNNPVASGGEVPHDPGETLPGYLKQPPPSQHESSQAGVANVTAPSSHSPSPTLGKPERVLVPLPSSHRPTPSICQTMCYTFKRRWTMPWFIYSLPGFWQTPITRGSYLRQRSVIIRMKLI